MTAGVAETDSQQQSGDEKRLVKNPHVRVVFCGNDEILIKHGGRSRYSQVLQDEGRSGLISKVLRGFAEPATLSGLLADGVVRADETDSARELVTYLVDRQVLIEPETYLPGVYLRMQFGNGASAIGARTIGLVGAGPLGTRIAGDLAQLRPKALVLLDDRPLAQAELTSFGTGVTAEQVGRPYAELAAAGIPEGDTAVRTAEGSADDEAALTELFEQVDVVVVALECYSPQVLHAVNATALAVGKPWMSVFSDGSQAMIGPIYVPGDTPCYAEFEIQQEATVALRDDYLVYKETIATEGWHTGAALLRPYLSIMAGWATVGLLNFLTGAEPFAVGRCVWLDFERLSVDYQDVLKLPRCPACLQQQTGYPRHMFL